LRLHPERVTIRASRPNGRVSTAHFFWAFVFELRKSHHPAGLLDRQKQALQQVGVETDLKGLTGPNGIARDD
jgi:hypothetical protein